MTKTKASYKRVISISENDNLDTELLQKRGIKLVEIYRLGLQEMKASQGLSISKKVC